ncbi:hypothetical protein BJY04DRAFT_231631 [Aspergillus karnatakaensis]|uniref:uncharacterized protein n=1 Tax=Aspergillus karnatakaensis TaxID=1810916 RepID=UPI003CCDAD9D
MDAAPRKSRCDGSSSRFHHPLHSFIRVVQGELWVDKVNETHRTGHLCQWVSSFHPKNLPCQSEGPSYHGAFNVGIKMIFSATPPGCPCPKVHACGSAASNVLGLGPFIMMDFVDGVSLSDIIKDPNTERPTSVMREDISDSDIKCIYGQLASFLLQLFLLDFDQIGSLPSPHTKAQSPPLPRPLTFKAHSILQFGGVDTSGDRALGFTTTTEYFQYVVKQDWEQLIHQPNSTTGPYHAQNKYTAFKVLEGLVPDFVHPKYDHCKFKLIYDNLGLANLIIHGKEDLTVVRVVDLEYHPRLPLTQYFKSFETFIRVLEEEEAIIPEFKEKELSILVKYFPFTQLRRHIGAAEWTRREKEFEDAEELAAFAARKVSDLEKYDAALEKLEEKKALVDSGLMTKEEFVINAYATNEIEYLACKT